MNRQKVNFIAATVSIVLAIQALIVVLLAVATDWDRHLTDEGAAAHIFQILIMAEGLATLGFLGTAGWKRVKPGGQGIGAQAAIFVATFATGHILKL